MCFSVLSAPFCLVCLVCLYVCPPLGLYVCVRVCVRLRVCRYQSMLACVRPFWLYGWPSVCLCVCLALSVCMPVCLYVALGACLRPCPFANCELTCWSACGRPAGWPVGVCGYVRACFCANVRVCLYMRVFLHGCPFGCVCGCFAPGLFECIAKLLVCWPACGHSAGRAVSRLQCKLPQNANHQFVTTFWPLRFCLAGSHARVHPTGFVCLLGCWLAF